MNGKIKVQLNGKNHWTDLKPGKTYEAEICRNNHEIIFIENDYGEEYGYPAADFRIIED